MGKWCLHASSFIFDRIIIKVAGNQDRHKSLVEFEFGPNQTTHFGVTCPWVTKIQTFELEYLWSQLANLDHILCVVSLGRGKGCIRFWARLTMAHWTRVSDHCPLGYLFVLVSYYFRPLPYNIITGTLQFNHGFSTKCIGYNTSCIDWCSYAVKSDWFYKTPYTS